MLDFDHVSFRYPELNVISELSINVAASEFVCLLGQSGSGKTTIINLAAGYLRPSRGEVRFDDKIITSPGLNRTVVFQEDGLFPWFTVSQNIEFGARKSGRSDKESVVSLLDRSGLSGFGNAFPRQLSGGMKKRTELARAFATRSQMLLLDEPFGSLDVITRQKMHQFLEGMWLQDQKCILMVTHDPEEALLLADRIVVLSKRLGRIDGMVAVNWSRPRLPKLRFDPEFLDQRRKLEELIAGN